MPIQRNREGERRSFVELLLERNLEAIMLATAGDKPVSPPCRPVPGLIPFQVDLAVQAMKILHAWGVKLFKGNLSLVSRAWLIQGWK